MTGTLDGSLSLERCLPLGHLPIILIVNLNFGDSEKFERTFNLLTGSNSTFKRTYLEKVSTTAFKDVSLIKVSVSKAPFSRRSICLSPKREVSLAFEDFSFSRT